MFILLFNIYQEIKLIDILIIKYILKNLKENKSKNVEK